MCFCPQWRCSAVIKHMFNYSSIRTPSVDGRLSSGVSQSELRDVMCRNSVQTQLIHPHRGQEPVDCFFLWQTLISSNGKSVKCRACCSTWISHYYNIEWKRFINTRLETLTKERGANKPNITIRANLRLEPRRADTVSLRRCHLLPLARCKYNACSYALT